MNTELQQVNTLNNLSGKVGKRRMVEDKRSDRMMDVWLQRGEVAREEGIEGEGETDKEKKRGGIGYR